MLVSYLRKLREIGTYSVICRIIDKNSLGIRIVFDGFLKRINLHTESNPDNRMDLELNVNRQCSAKDQCIDHALVNVSGNNDLVSRFAYGKNHCLNGTGGSSYH